MKTAIMTVGNELVTGRIRDKNAAVIAKGIHAQGWQVIAVVSVGDNKQDMAWALNGLLSRADAVIVTGGLGPTADDVTTAAVAEILGLPLYRDEAVLRRIMDLFAARGLKWTENNAKQAYFPAGARIIPNPVGTADGFALRHGEGLIVVIPGVPSEAARMFAEGVLPLLRETFPGRAKAVASRTFKLFGLSEAAVDEALSGLDPAGRGVEIGFYPEFPENHLVVTARADDAAEASRRLEETCREVETLLRRYVFAYDEDTLEGVVSSLLMERGLTLAIAESCTGGLITDRLTDVPGSSAFLIQGIVAYSNRAKMALLGVPEEVLLAHGAVSDQTAVLMARGVRAAAGTDLGLSVTGIAGPTGGSEEKPVGTVYMALADNERSLCRRYRFRWNRRRNKIISSQAALILLKDYLMGE